MTGPESHWSSCCVLVVDDSELQRRHAARLCSELGVGRIVEAAHGLDALEQAALLEAPPDLWIIDLEMPEMDGIELVEALQLRGVRSPIVLLSGRENALIESVQSLGFSVQRALRKPLESKDLQEALQACLVPQRAAAEGGARASAMPSGIDAQALEEAIRCGQIVPHFQPKIDTNTGILRGVEALARWNDPERGMVPPDQFIALAERASLIHALTLSVLDQSFAQCALWQSRGMRLTMAVNVSPELLTRPDIVTEICALQRQHGLHPSQITLEITESTAVESQGAAHAALARLRLKGFGLSIDDYGTGFSSMQQLSRIPFTELKIDRSFVHGAPRRKSLRVILESALDMARRLNLSTVAEGVETLEDWRMLQSFGCTSAQGWLIAKAMPGRELPAWNKAHGARLPEFRLPR